MREGQLAYWACLALIDLGRSAAKLSASASVRAGYGGVSTTGYSGRAKSAVYPFRDPLSRVPFLFCRGEDSRVDLAEGVRETRDTRAVSSPMAVAVTWLTWRTGWSTKDLLRVLWGSEHPLVLRLYHIGRHYT